MGGRTLDPGERKYSPHRGEGETRGAVGWRSPDRAHLLGKQPLDIEEVGTTPSGEAAPGYRGGWDYTCWGSRPGYRAGWDYRGLRIEA